MATSTDAPRLPPYKVVVAIDFTTAGAGVLERALELASVYPRAEVHVLSVLEPEPVVRSHDVPADAMARLPQIVAEAVTAFARKHPFAAERVVTHVLNGTPAREIVWLAAHLDADLVMLGTHDRKGAMRVVLGSVAEKVLRTAGCPVLVVRPKNHPAEWKEAAIEPPCPECAKAREASGGRTLWCEHHSGRHFHKHVYSWSEPGTGSFRPWGFSNG